MFILLNPSSEDTRKNTYPLGLAYIAAAMEKHGKTTVLDLHYDNDLCYVLYSSIMSKKYKFLGITLCSVHVYESFKIARLVKRLTPEIIIGIGGSHATFMGKEILEQCREIDVCFIGAGEHAASKVAENLAAGKPWMENVKNVIYRNEDKVIQTDFDEYDKDFIKRPARHLLPSILEYAHKLEDTPTLSIDTSRGCPGKCAFCTFSLSRRRRWICRRIEDVINDIKCSIDENNLDKMDVYFTDADFLASTSRATKLIKAMRDIPQVDKYIIAARPDSIIKSKSLLDELFKSGCANVEIGIETSAESQLRRYGKGTTPEINNEAVEILNQYKSKYTFSISVDLIPFDPFVTWNELYETNVFLQKYFYGDVQNEFAFIHEMMLAPGSKYRENVITTELSDAGSPISLPFWQFKHKECANIYAALLYYRNTLIKYKTNIRAKLLNSYAECSLSKKEKIKLYRSHRYIDTVTYDFINTMLQNKAKDNIVDVIDKIKDKLQEINVNLDYIRLKYGG